MIRLKSPAEIDAIAEAGAILGRLFEAIGPEIRPGRSTWQLDRFAEDFIRSYPGAEPAFKGLYGFPSSLCISVNHEVVHGIPKKNRTLKDGDIVSVDAGVRLEGWFADAAVTFPVGEVDPSAALLLEVTEDALSHGIKAAKAGNRLGDIGHAVQKVAEKAGFSVVRCSRGWFWRSSRW
jgi:methionyl aminopeptidase